MSERYSLEIAVSGTSKLYMSSDPVLLPQQQPMSSVPL